MVRAKAKGTLPFRILSALVALTFVMSMSTVGYAVPRNGNGQGQGGGDSAATVLPVSDGQTTLEGYRLGQNKWTTGNLAKDYVEGDWVPYRAIVYNNTSDPFNYVAFSFDYDHYLNTGGKNAVGFDKTRNWRVVYTTTDPGSGDPMVGGGDPITPSSQDVGAYGSDARLVTSFPEGTLTLQPGEYAVVYFDAHLSITAWWLQQSPSHWGSAFYPGSSLQMRLNLPSGDKTVTLPLPPESFGNVGGLKYNDLNGNGVRDAGEPPLSGWVFHLTGGPEGWPLDLTATSDSDGFFAFHYLVPGSYTLNENAKANWHNTNDPALPFAVAISAGATSTVEIGNQHDPVKKTFRLTYAGAPSGATFFVKYAVDGGSLKTLSLTGDNPYSASVDVAYASTITAVEWWAHFAGEDILLKSQSLSESMTEDKTNSFTYAASVAGTKFFDHNENTTRDAGDEGLGGWEITLSRVPAGGGSPVVYATTTTASDGSYSFGGLLPGDYTLAETMQIAWQQTVAPIGTFAVAAGSALTGKDFGNAHQPDGILVTKSGPTVAHVGDTITYHVTVQNTGLTTLAPVVVSDPLTGLNVTIPSLASGASQSWDVPYTIKSSDPDPLPNTVSAIGTNPFGAPVPDAASWNVDIVHPDIQIVKTVDKPVITSGDPVTYSFAVQNTGDTPLVNVSVNDDKLGHIGDIASLAAGELVTLTKTTTLSAGVTNVATAAGVDGWGFPVSDTDDATVRVVNPAIELTKSVNKPVILSGDTVEYSYLVENTGDVPLLNVSVDDNKIGHIGDIASLAVGASATLTKTAVISVDTDNIGTAAGTDEWGHQVSDTDTASVNVVGPAVSLAKSATPLVGLSGDLFSYTYVITNTGDVTLYNLALDDVPLGHIGDVSSLGVGQSATITTTTPIMVSTLNVGTVIGYDEFEHQVGASDTAEVRIVDPGISVAKSVDKPVVIAGETVTYTYVITNTGDVPLQGITLDDDKLGHIGDVASLAVGATTTLTKSTTLSVSTDNVATVVGFDEWQHRVTDSDEASVRVVRPSITIDKTANKAVILSGETVVYTYVITNNGDVPLSGVAITDNKLGTVTSGQTLAVDGSATFTSTTNLLVTTENIGTVTGRDEWGHQVSDNDPASVRVVNPQVGIVKTANPIVGLPGTSVTYTFEVTNLGDVPLQNLSVDDNKLGHIGDIASLAVGASATLTKSSALVVSTLNIGSVAGTDEWGHPVSASDDASVTIVNPGISLVKTVDKPVIISGETVTYTYVITNTGDVPLLGASLDDDKLGHIGDIASLGIGASATLTKTAAIATSTLNVGTVVAFDEFQHRVTAEDDAAVTVTAPAISVVKTSDAPELGVEVGTTVVYTYVVTNTGDVPLVNVALVDDKLGSIANGITLAVGESRSFTASAQLSLPTTNVVTATGQDALGHSVSDTDDEFVDILVPFTPPDLTIEKSADPVDAIPGEVVTYTLRYRNLSIGGAQDITIVDDYDQRYMDVENANGGTVSGGKITWHVFTDTALLDTDGWQTLTYTLRVHDEMPSGTTHIDNVVVISVDQDSDLSNNTDTARVDVGFLPFTGGAFPDPTAALIAAFGAIALLIGLRRRQRHES